MHEARSFDHEKLQVITIWEPGVDRKQIKKLNRYTKKHAVLNRSKNGYEYVENTR